MVFAVSFLLFAILTNTGYVENDLSRIATIESLVERHTFVIDDASAQPKVDKVALGGHYYSDKPPILSIIGAVPYLLLSNIGISLREHTALAYRLITLSVVGFSTALLAVVFNRALKAEGLARGQSLFLTAVLLTATPIFNYSVTYNSHTVAAFLLFAGYLLTAGHAGKKTAFLAGLSTGLCAAVEMPVGLIFLAAYAAIMIVLRRGFKDVLIFSAAAALPLTAHAILNIHLLGDLRPAVMHPEYWGYPGSEFYGENSGWFGATHSPGRIEYLLNALFGVQGFLSTTPVLAFGALVFIRNLTDTRRENAARLIMAAASVLTAAFYLLFTSSYGGNAHSFRYLIPLVPLLVFASADLLKEEKTRKLHTLLIFAAFYSFFMAQITKAAFYQTGAPWVNYSQNSFIAASLVSAALAAYVLASAHAALRKTILPGMSYNRGLHNTEQ